MSIDQYIEQALREKIKRVCPGYGEETTNKVVEASLPNNVGLTTLRQAIGLVITDLEEARAEVARLTGELMETAQRLTHISNNESARANKAEAELQHDDWHQVEECMPNIEEMVLVVDVDIVRRGFWQYHGLDVEWRTADNRLIEVYWWKALPKLPWDGEK